MKYRWMTVILMMATSRWQTFKASDIKCTSTSLYICQDQGYRACCNNRCVRRRNCNYYCYYNADCHRADKCVNHECSSKPSDYCDSNTLCKYGVKCLENKCIEEKKTDCSDGECREDSKPISWVLIAGILPAVILLLCCGICLVWRRSRHQQQQRNSFGEQNCQQQQQQQEGQGDQRQQQQQQQLEQQSYPLELHVVLPVEGIQQQQPLHPGGPPPYHSLEHLNQLEEPPPPTYQEAIRNSNNQLEV